MNCRHPLPRSPPPIASAPPCGYRRRHHNAPSRSTSASSRMAFESLRGRAFQPANPLDRVVVDAFSQQVHEAQVVLGLRVTPSCPTAIPPCSPGEILSDDIAPRVRCTDVVLPHRVPREACTKELPDEMESRWHTHSQTR